MTSLCIQITTESSYVSDSTGFSHFYIYISATLMYIVNSKNQPQKSTNWCYKPSPKINIHHLHLISSPKGSCKKGTGIHTHLALSQASPQHLPCSPRAYSIIHISYIYHIISYQIKSYHIHIILYRIISYSILSYHIITYHILYQIYLLYIYLGGHWGIEQLLHLPPWMSLIPYVRHHSKMSGVMHMYHVNVYKCTYMYVCIYVYIHIDTCTHPKKTTFQ